jgi:hypothetical protein
VLDLLAHLLLAPGATRPLVPVEEMLATALHNSRAQVRRLMDRQSELEAELVREQKQAARLQWLLTRVR